jgi:DNA invertase Pin-like site-specific DNA recombinase
MDRKELMMTPAAAARRSAKRKEERPGRAPYVRWISYCRVSTDRQGRSGLGLDAQRAAIASYLTPRNGQLVGEYVEVESGKVDDRPKLREALEACQRTGARLIIAKLDRLSRDVAFIAGMMKSSADFVVCDYPDANRLTLHIMAAVAESEREMISRRTREALAAARARGVKLGKPDNLTPTAAKLGRKLGTKARSERSKRFATRMWLTIEPLLDAGLSLRAIARKLNEDGTLTASGKQGAKWTAAGVQRVLTTTSPSEGRPR